MKKVFGIWGLGFVLVFLFAVTGYAQPGRFDRNSSATKTRRHKEGI